MIEGVIIILSSYNDDRGELTGIAKSRLNKGIEEYTKNKNYKILLTGGCGAHFNPTSKPHSYYAQQYLLSRGIQSCEILEFAESKYTLEDALLAKKIVEHYAIKKLIIVSSDYHIQRVQYIFDRIFSGYILIYSSAVTNVSKKEMERLIQEESEKLVFFINNNDLAKRE